jgi:fatty acid amide hydrolase 2
MNKLLTISGVKLAEMIRGKEVSSQEVVETHINQIKKVNPVINAVVKDRFEQARQEAKAAD